MCAQLNISIVIYGETPPTFNTLLHTLQTTPDVNKLYVIDNSPVPRTMPQGIIYIHNRKNIGYGKAHNIAMHKTISEGVKYHLVLNPDIEIEQGALEQLLAKMNQDETIGLLMPQILNPEGEVQHLCKLLPHPLDLLIRRFAPHRWHGRRKEHYEMTWTGYDKEMQVPYLSGCFMMLRTDALRTTGLFDPRYFLYPEDIDLSRRIARNYKNIYYPQVKITHQHKRESYKSLKMTIIHAYEMTKYFCKWGWIIDPERDRMNTLAEQQKL